VLSKKALNGAFVIPDKTPVTNIIESDQISFLFDILHAASNSTEPTNHAMVFIRDGRGEYYTGDSETKARYRSISNATIGEHTLNLLEPFSQAQFNISNSKDSWQGEFSIYFRSDPELYGFAIQQIDYHISSDQTLKSHFINFPANHTRANIPFTWGDISFFGLKEYVNNIQKFCPKNPTIAPSNNMVLCTTINPASIEEKVPTRLNIIGSIGDLVNGTGIKDQIKADIINAEGYAVRWTEPDMPLTDGSYRLTLSDVGLDSGSYQVMVKPTNFTDFNTTAELVVNRHVPTIDESITQLGTYFGVIAGALGLIAFVPRLNSHFVAKRQRKNVYSFMNDIIEVYDTHRDDKETYLEQLGQKCIKALEMFNSGDISEEQYGTLDRKIIEYEQKNN
jgi:hypothetical protein